MRGAFTAVAVLAAVSAAAADDKKYESKDGKFAIAFPAGKEVKTQTQEQGGVKLQIAGVEEKDKARMVMFFDLPAQAKDAPVKTLMDAMQKGALDKSGGKLVKATETTFGAGKLPARDLMMEKDGNKIRTLLVLDGVRVYMVLVGGPKDFATEKEAAAFVESFELKK